MVRNDLGTLHHNSQSWEAAESAYITAISIFRDIGDRHGEATTLGNLGELQMARGDLADARVQLEAAADLAQARGGLGGPVLRQLARVRARQGAFAEAMAMLEETEVQLGGTDPVSRGTLLCARAEVAHLAGDVAETNKALEEVDGIIGSLGLQRQSELGRILADTRRVIWSG